MTTRAELRTAVRQRLEDTAATPLWDDAALNEFLTAAMRQYGARFPQEVVTSVAVTAGDTEIPLSSAAITSERIARVRDDTGAEVPRQIEARGGDGHHLGHFTAQAWRWWDGALILQRPAATTGSWRIEHLSGRTLPGDDESAVAVVPGDEDIVIVLAAAIALDRRAIEDAKRGTSGKMGTPIATAARRAWAEVDRLIAGRKRRVAGGWLR